MKRLYRIKPWASRLERYSMPEPNSGCHLWLGKVSRRTGYGHTSYRKRELLAHRAAYEAAHGPIPDGSQVLHKCDVRSCVNPDHLFLGTHSDNMADRNAKKRHSHGERHGCAKLSESDALAILFATGRLRDIANQYGIHESTVAYIKAGKLWRHVTSPFLRGSRQRVAA